LQGQALGRGNRRSRCLSRKLGSGQMRTHLFRLAAICAAFFLALSAPSFAQNVPYQRIVQAGSAPNDWLTYSGNYNSQRYSALNQINRQNVKNLRPAWMYQIKKPGVFEASPIVADGAMYI